LVIREIRLVVFLLETNAMLGPLLAEESCSTKFHFRQLYLQINIAVECRHNSRDAIEPSRVWTFRDWLV